MVELARLQGRDPARLSLLRVAELDRERSRRRKSVRESGRVTLGAVEEGVWERGRGRGEAEASLRVAGGGGVEDVTALIAAEFSGRRSSV